MNRKVLAFVLSFAVMTACMPAYAEGEPVDVQVSAPVQTAPAPEPAAPAPAPEAPAPVAEAPATEAATEVAATEVPATEEPTAVPTQEPFKATAKVEIKNKGQIYFGDKVTIKVKVTNANAPYTVRWEYYNVKADVEHGENPWVQFHTGEKYEFKVNEENAKLTYRIYVNDLLVEKDYKLPAVKEKPVEEPEEVVDEAEEPTDEGVVDEVEEPAEDEEVADEAEEPAEDEEVADEVEEPAEDEEVTDEVEEPVEDEEPAEGEEEAEEAEEPVEDLADLLNPDRSIEIHAEWEGEELHFGDEVTLIATLVGYEGAEYSIQWETSADNENWTIVEGATGDSYTVVVTEDNYQDYWHVIVTVTDVVMEDAE